jgi:outer membrane protein assembly factor BamB
MSSAELLEAYDRSVSTLSPLVVRCPPSVGAVDDAVVVQANERLLALDARSGRVEWEAPIDEGTLLVAAPPPAGPAGVGSTAASLDAVALLNDGGFIVAADLASGQLENLGEASLAAVDDRSAFLLRGAFVRAFSDAVEGVAAWESELPLDHSYSEPIRLTAGDASVAVLIGSDVGPNQRLVVLDAQTGDVRWQADGVRDSTIANGVLVADRRHGLRPEGLTRQVLGRDLVTGEQLWLRASSGVLGGYLGTSAAGPVFGVGRDALSSIDRVVRLDAATGKGTLGSNDPLSGATAPESTALVTDELIVLPDRPSTVTTFDGSTTERRWQRHLRYPMRSARVTNAGLLVAAGDSDYGC